MVQLTPLEHAQETDTHTHKQLSESPYPAKHARACAQIFTPSGNTRRSTSPEILSTCASSLASMALLSFSTTKMEASTCGRQ